MEIYGINNITDKELRFNYDKYYRELALNLKKAETENEKKEIKNVSKEKMEDLLKDIKIDDKVLKNNFIRLILDEKSSKYLWILYSKYDNTENYIDKISSILRQENQIIRGGTNTYKLNGWMTHTLYVYQISNDNIAYNTEIINFNGNLEIKKQVQELHELFKMLSKESKFILKIFALIHDIGVIEDIIHHDKLGSKYVEDVLQEIGLNQKILDDNDFLININDLTIILQELIKYHTLITALSSECSDAFVETEYRNLINNIPKIENIKKDISKILMILAYGDVIGVDESLMDAEKYTRIKDCYYFFEEVSKYENFKRDKEKVAIERICDIVGEKKVQNLKIKFNDILKKNKINKENFVEDMYNIWSMRFAAPLMKTLKDVELTIKIFYELFELIGYIETKEELKKYAIVFVPDKHENDFVEQFKNGNFFKAIEEMKTQKVNECTYENVNIIKRKEADGKCLYIKVV